MTRVRVSACVLIALGGLAGIGWLLRDDFEDGATARVEPRAIPAPAESPPESDAQPRAPALEAALPIPSPPETAREASFEIRGVVVDSAHGAPVADAAIEIGRKFVRAREWKGVTDREGRFVARVEGTQHRASCEWLAVRAVGFAVREVVLPAKAGIPERQTDAGTIALDRGSRVSGRFVDRSGAPIFDAEVVRTPDRALEISMIDFGETVARTDADGRFAIEAVPARPTNKDLLFFVSARGCACAEFAVAAPETAVDLGDVKARESGTILVTAADESGSPFLGARVRIQPRFPSFVFGAAERREPWFESRGADWLPFVATTQADGSVQVASVPLYEEHAECGAGNAWSYDVLVTAPGFLDVWTRVRLDRRQALARASVTLKKERATRLEFTVTDERRAAFEGVVIRVNVSTEGAPASDVELRTDALGRASLDCKSYVPAFVATATRDGFAPWKRWIETGGEHVKRIAIELRPCSPLDGEVVDANGIGVVGATVTLVPADDRDPPRPTTTIPTGKFGFGCVERGRWMAAVRFDDLGCFMEPEVIVVFEHPAHGPLRIVAHRCEGRCDAVLVRGVRGGDASAARAPEPLASALLVAVPPGGLIHTGPRFKRSRAADGVRFHDVLPGSYEAWVFAENGDRGHRIVDVPPGPELVVDIVLESPGIVKGTVVDAEGRPLAHAEVSSRSGGLPCWVEDPHPFESLPVFTDDEGRFCLANLPAGETVLQAAVPATGAFAIEPVTVIAGHEVEATIRIDPATTGTIAVLLPPQAPEGRYSIVFESVAAPAWSRTTAVTLDKRGDPIFPTRIAVPPGQARLRVKFAPSAHGRPSGRFTEVFATTVRVAGGESVSCAVDPFGD